MRAEAEDAETRWRQDLELALLAHELLHILGVRDPARDGLANCRKPEVADREPDLERASTSCELLAVIREVHLLVSWCRILQVFRQDVKRRFQHCGIARQQA